MCWGGGQSGKNVKDMGQFKFWGTQPVPRFGELLSIRGGEGWLLSGMG